MRAFVLLDGTDVILSYQPVIELPADDVRVGLRVSAVWASPAEEIDGGAGGMGGAYGNLLGWIPDGRARHRRPRPREPDLLMSRPPPAPTSPSSAGPTPRWSATPSSPRPSSCWRSSPTPSTPLGLTRADIDFTCLGSCDYITGQAFSFVQNLDAIGAWPPEAGLPRRDGRGLGPLRGLAAPAGGRHRHRRGHRFRPFVHRRPGAHLPDGDGPVLPGAAGGRPPHLRRPAGPGGDRRRASPTSARWPRSPCARRGKGDVDALLTEDYVRAPLRRHDIPPDHRRRGRHGPGPGRPGPRAGRTTRLHHRLRPPHRGPQPVASGPWTTRRRSASRPRLPASATARWRSPSCRRPSPTRSSCCGRSSTSATT